MTGRNSFLLRQELHTQVSRFMDQHGEMAVERIDGENVTAEEGIQRIVSTSLFVSDKLVVLRDISRNKELSEALLPIIQAPPNGTDILIIEPTLDARSKLYKVLKKSSVFKEYNEAGPEQLASWIRSTVKSLGGSINTSDSMYLVSLVGVKQQQLNQEIEKLIIYSPDIDRKTIDLLVEPGINSKSFDVAEAAFSGNPGKAVKIYLEQRALRVDPLVIIGSLAWQLHVLVMVKSVASRRQLGSECGVSPWSLDKAFALSKKVTYSQLVAAIDRLIAIDTKSKSAALNIDDALVYFLLTL